MVIREFFKDVKKTICILFFIYCIAVLHGQTATNLFLNPSFEIPSNISSLYLLDTSYQTTPLPCWVDGVIYGSSNPLSFPPFNVDSNFLVLPNHNIPDGKKVIRLQYSYFKRKVNISSFISAKLYKKLVSGTTYYFSCYVNVLRTGSDSSACFTNSKKLDIILNQQPTSYTSNSIYTVTPSFSVTIDSFPLKSGNTWRKIQTIFTSNTDARYLTIGVIDSSVINTYTYPGIDTFIQNKDPDSVNYYADLFIDHLTLIPLSDTSKTIINQNINESDSVLDKHYVSICGGESIALNSGNYVSYLWNTGDTTSSITVSQPGTYIINVDNGCRILNDTVIITVKQTPSLSISSVKSALCITDSTTLTATGLFSHYSWSTGDTIQQIIVHQPGTYTCTATNGCVADTATITISPRCSCGDTFDLPSGYGICRNSTDSLTITATASPSFHLLWSTGDTTSAIKILQAGTYYCTAYSFCDTLLDSTIVDYIHLMQSYTDSLNLCHKNNVLLKDLQIPIPSLRYHWSTNDTTDSIFINQSGIYYCTVTDYCTTVIDTFIVTDCPPTANFTATTQSLCAGECVQFTDSSLYNPTIYRWTFAGGHPAQYIGKNPPPICYSDSGSYAVSLAVANAYSSDSIFFTNYITVFPAPQKQTVTTDFNIKSGDSITLQACAIADSYAWKPDVACANCSEITIVPTKENTTYQCTATTHSGCAVVCTYHVTVSGLVGTIYIPNAFSPNADGNNDVWEVYTQNAKVISTEIFNRWGEKVYSSGNLYPSWDGVYKNMPQPPGVYSYQISYLLNGETESRLAKGSISLIK